MQNTPRVQFLGEFMSRTTIYGRMVLFILNNTHDSTLILKVHNDDTTLKKCLYSFKLFKIKLGGFGTLVDMSGVLFQKCESAAGLF